jgi:hypothetical protein
MPSAARITSPEESHAPVSTLAPAHSDGTQVAQEESDGESDNGATDDTDLMVWVDQQRTAKVSWDIITQETNARGYTITKKALGLRYLRWRRKTEQSDQPESVG